MGNDKVGKTLGWGLDGEMTLQAQEAKSVSLDKEFGHGPKSTEMSLETLKQRREVVTPVLLRDRFDWDI